MIERHEHPVTLRNVPDWARAQREWCEQNLNEDEDVRWDWWPECHDTYITNKTFVFCFREPEDAVMFKLTFSELVVG